MPTNSGWGVVQWGVGYYGLPFQPQPSNPLVNIINVTPMPGSFNIFRSQTFTFTIKTKFNLNPNTIFVGLDSKVVISGSYINTTDFTVVQNMNIDGISKDYVITPNYLFTNNAVFTLQISATDVYGNPSPPFWAGYVVEDTRPPLVTPIYPLDGYINVPIDLTIHFLINQLAAPDTGLDRSTINININGTPAVINSIIQPEFNGEYSVINFPIVGDITTPFEILLDYAGRYTTDDIITIQVSVNELVIPPVVGIDGYIINSLGQVAAQGTIISSVTALSAGQYSLLYDAPLTTYVVNNASILDGYTVIDTAGNSFIIEQVGIQNVIVITQSKKRSDKYFFVTATYESQLVTPVFSGYFQGVYLVDNLGDGYHVNVTWHPARTTRPDYDLAFLIYYSTTRSDVFYEEPKLITQGRKLSPPETVQGADSQLFGFYAQVPLPVGITYYFGIRATEYPHSATPVVPADGYGSYAAGFKVVDGYSFAIPSIQFLTSNISGSGFIIIPVTTTAGYPIGGGYILVGSEIMRYTSLTGSTFIVPAISRGLFGTSISTAHNAGEVVKMYYGNQDDNTVIAKNLVSWESPNDPHRTRPDLVTTDFTLEDGYHTGFEWFDYCGYHRSRPDELLDDQQCGTYVGGEYNGHRGLFIFDRMLANEEQLLEVTGEPAILLRRIWSGERCICTTSRKDNAKVRSCALCFGTGFKGGFIQYRNPRREDNKIMVHFAPSDEELGMGAQSGWDQKFKPGTWTIAVPAIKDRDVLVRFNEFGEMDWVYVVDAVSRAKNMFGRYARQRLRLSRLDKTDVMYKFKLMR